jgi:hypothetical protein
MNALGSPAAAGTDNRTLSFDRSDWLRLIGGMMLGAGALVLLIRKANDWSDWAIFAALLIPAVVLLGLAFMRRAPRDGAGAGAAVDERQGWTAAFLVFGTLLLLSALLQLVNAAGGQARGWNLVWTFGVAGAVAVFTSFALRAPFQMLLGALFGLVAWLAFWDKVLSNPSGETLQWLLVVLAVIYFVGAIVLGRAGQPQSLDLITAAAIAAVLAAALTFAGLAGSFSGVSASSLPGNVPKPSQGWNIFLLVVSLAAIGFGSRGPTRGPSYVGALGLGAFIALVGVDVVHRISGGGSGGVVGWPLILLIGGAAVLVAGFILRPGAPGGSGGPAFASPGGPGQGAYAAPPAAGAGAQPTPPATPTQQPPAQAPPPGDQPTQQQQAPGQGETQVHRQPPPPGAPPPQ